MESILVDKNCKTYGCNLGTSYYYFRHREIRKKIYIDRKKQPTKAIDEAKKEKKRQYI